jgi:hypothetical protein
MWIRSDFNPDPATFKLAQSGYGTGSPQSLNPDLDSQTIEDTYPAF